MGKSPIPPFNFIKEQELYKHIMILLTVIFFCGCLSDDALRLSVDTNTAILQKYQKVSDDFMTLLVDIKEQKQAQGQDVGGLEEWIIDLKKDDSDVLKIMKAFRGMISAMAENKTEWCQYNLSIVDNMIEVYNAKE